MKRFLAFPSALAFAGAMLLAAPAAAQDATPVAPAPELCTLAPPTFERISQLAASPVAAEAASPEASPVAELPPGEPVDDATREAVQQSLIIDIACLNSGSTLLTLAVYSDAAQERLLGGAGPISEEFYNSLATPQPIAEGDRTVIIEFQDMVKLPDGRIAAIVVGDDPTNADPAGATLFYLTEKDGHWYIDDFVNPNS